MKGYACVHGLTRVDLSGVAGVRKAAGPPAPPRDGDVGQGEGLFSSSQLFNSTLRRLTLFLYLRVVLHDGSHLCLPCHYCMQKEEKENKTRSLTCDICSGNILLLQASF